MTMMLFNVFGGLAIFIFGMTMMSDGLHKAAGEKMRSILRFFSANRFVAILSGTLVTAVIQSSSASTVMVIGFVNAGLLNLAQSIGIIFGANIGTTVTAQLVAFDIGWIIMPAIIVGLLMNFIRDQVWHGWGATVLGFGFLFLGMNIMSNDLKELSSDPSFVQIFSTFNCMPLNGWIPPGALFGAIVIGLAATLIIQSSSACTGIIIALGAGGIINIYTAVALVLGSNIGTTITAQLAAIPANRIAKQAALAHTLFNVIGVAVMVSTFWIRVGEGDAPLFFAVINHLSGGGDLPRHIANAHTVFNLFTTLLLVPFIPLLAKICEKVIPLRKEKVDFQRLEPHLLETPSIALDQSVAALRHMLSKAWKMVDCAFAACGSDDAKLLKKRGKLAEMESRIDAMQADITDYLSQLMQRVLSPKQAAAIPLLIHCTNDAERIGDHMEIIVDLDKKLRHSKTVFSETAQKELNQLRKLLDEQAACTLLLLEKFSPEKFLFSEELKNRIPELSSAFENNHLKRLNNEKCSHGAGVFYIELLSEIEKVSRHLGNISERTGKLNQTL